MYLGFSAYNRLLHSTMPLCLMLVLAGTTWITAASPQKTAVEEIKKRLLVVYNENDPDARELAFSYALARQLDRSQIFSIQCPTDEIITRDIFNQQIRSPIRNHLIETERMHVGEARVNFGQVVKKVEVARQNDIWAIVLIRGIPLKIKNDITLPIPPNMPAQFHKNEAAVDSELSLLMYDTMELNGFIPNPYYTEDVLRAFDAKMALSLIMVARLDGPTKQDVQRMIHDAVTTEQLELTGRSYFDARGITDQNSGYKIGDDWIRSASALAQNAGLEVYLDDKDPLLDSQMPVEDIAIYAGWYAGDFTGPFGRKNFKFRPGSVAYHLHSFSANSIRTTSKHWVGPLISRGATVTMGSVYEPYLRLTPNLSTFFHSLLSGQCFAEAAYQSQMGLSWMITIVGDPLYRPFPRSSIESAQIAQRTNSKDSPWLCLRVARQICQQSMPRAEKIERVTRMVDALPHSITYEGLGNILNDLKAPGNLATEAFRKAETIATTETGKIRNGLHIAHLFARQGEIEKSMAEYERLLASYPDAARAFNIPNLAIAYAAQNGWTRFSPEMQTFLAPVSEEHSQSSTKDSDSKESQPASNTTGIPVQPRKDLIPQKPTLAPPKSGPANQQQQPQNPNKIPFPGS
ncbi:MAG: TIGR03790 family protein [Verrucomicrobiota bacterium]